MGVASLLPRLGWCKNIYYKGRWHIKDKKYRGGLVIEPKQGIHFKVVVMDFASLYPSIIKVKNLSYETVRCSHEECKKNTIPQTNHWTCSKKMDWLHWS